MFQLDEPQIPQERRDAVSSLADRPPPPLQKGAAHFYRCSGGFEPYPSVVEADAPANGVEQAGVFQRRVGPHGRIGVHPRLSAYLPLDDDAVDRDVVRTGGPVAEAERKADDAGPQGLGGLDRADHGLLASASDVELAAAVGRTDDLDLLAFAQPESFDIDRVDEDPVVRHECPEPRVGNGAALGLGDGAVGNHLEVVALAVAVQRRPEVVLNR